MQFDERSAHAPISESDLVEIIKQRVNVDGASAQGEVGVGDDAAVMRFDAGHIVLTADAMVEGVHFLAKSMSWHDIGWKCIVSNQSDIAAMGAVPEHAVLTLAIPTSTRIDDLEDLLSGVIRALDEFGGKLVGGDTVSSETIVLSVALTGRLHDADTPLTRDAARPGQLVAVTGPLGGSAGGLAVLEQIAVETNSRSVDSHFERLLNEHSRPSPRVGLAAAMVESGVKCAMDVSDGLLIDLERVCTASSVDAVIYADRVPINSDLLTAFPDRALELALTGGEDYELVYVGDAETIARVNEAQPEDVAPDFGVVGEIVPRKNSKGEVTVLDEIGAPIEFDDKGWDHFAR